MSAGPGRSQSWTDRVFRVVLRVFPFDFRADHGNDMERTLRAQHREARQEGSLASLVRLWLDVVRDVCTTAPREHAAILRQDLWYALRGLRRAPVFTVSAVLTLALGLSGMAGMFAIADAVMFRPLPVERPEQLISISNRTGVPNMSLPDLEDYRDTSVLADAIGYAPRPASLNVDGSVERISIDLVTDNYFSMLGVSAAAGRVIQPNEGRAPGDAPVLVLAYQFWQSRFGGDPSVIGRTMRVNGRPLTVVGVAERTFRGTESLIRVAAYVPASLADAFTDTPAAVSLFDDRSARYFFVLGRLKPGVSLDEARAALEVRAASLARDYPSTHKDVALRVVPETHARPTPDLGGFLRTALAALLGLAIVVLLITSANVTNLLMARAFSRRREVALRAALGARSGRLMRQFLTEAVTLALLGGVMAVPVVAVAMRVMRELMTGVSAVVNIDPAFTVDLRVVGATLAIAVAAGIVAGLAPAFSACRSDLGEMLKSGARGASAGSRGGIRSALIIAQVSLSLTLLVCGGLFVRSLDRARDVDLGFDPKNVYLASAAPGSQGYDAARRLTFYDGVRERLAALPGVEAVGWVSLPPLGISFDIDEVFPAVRPPDPDWRAPVAARADVSPDYFSAIRVPLVAGRSFDARDTARGKPVVIVNETLAGLLWPTQNAIGQRVVAEGAALEVVGVARDGKYQNIGEAPRPAIFRPLAQTSPRAATVAVRTSPPPGRLGQPCVEPSNRWTQTWPSTICVPWKRISTTGAHFFRFDWRRS